MPALDAIDRKILALLQTDSRMTMQELADKVEEVPAGMNKVRAARARERESTQLSRATHVSVPARPLAGARGLR